jgi:hypothetical protein
MAKRRQYKTMYALKELLNFYCTVVVQSKRSSNKNYYTGERETVNDFTGKRHVVLKLRVTTWWPQYEVRCFVPVAYTRWDVGVRSPGIFLNVIKWRFKCEGIWNIKKKKTIK